MAANTGCVEKEVGKLGSCGVVCQHSMVYACGQSMGYHHLWLISIVNLWLLTWLVPRQFMDHLLTISLWITYGMYG